MTSTDGVALDSALRLPYDHKLDPVQDVDADNAGDLFAKQSANALAGPLVWSGADFKDAQPYNLQLSKDDVVEIDNALAEFMKLGLDGDDVSRDNFPLPGLSRRLQACAETLHLGRGFFVVRGLEASNYTVEDSVIVLLGLASYVAEKRGRQDRKGNMLSHVTDSKQWTIPADRRHMIHTNAALPFHSDMGCDILSLQVRNTADKGGYTYLSSAWWVFNDLLNREPEVIKTLLTPNWPVQLSGRQGTYYLAPAFTFHDGKLLASLDPNRLGRHPSMTDSRVPSLTSSQRDALQAVSESAARGQLQLALKKGDILFFNNLAMLHRRDAYEDGEHSSRHMVRLWLRSQKLGWAIPDSMRLPWEAAYGENQKVKARIYSLFPVADYVQPRYTVGSAAFLIEEDSEGSGPE
ncbi:hypothetical protein AK830_g8729 [Neonectria ditissima]|uniref:TauD/TfdA-like domain-containing protein n=1 Tax=Neonectria ditissima TaxID=78410 RepID=A0A0P7BBL9_9HYPO|nr:hypothetical protein AK830_g8729 [Neonectria ditissima]